MSILASEKRVVHCLERPTVEITRYASGDLEVSQRSCRRKRKPVTSYLVSLDRENDGPGGRSAITEFSAESARRCLTAFRAVAKEFVAEICVTYPMEYAGLLDGRASKRHLDRLLIQIKRKYPGIKYAWVLEFQTRTHNPHYHILASHFVDKDWLAQTWARIVGSGLEKHLHSGTRVAAIKNQGKCADYMARYLTKMLQKRVPEGFENVGRFWGISRGLVEKYSVKVRMAYETTDELKRDTRFLRKARSHFLKKKYGIKWRSGGSRGHQGYTDRQTPPDVADRLIDYMGGEVLCA